MSLRVNIYTSPRTLLKEKIIFTRHLAILLKTGTPILDALGTLRDQARHGVFKEALERICREVAGGRTLSTAFKKYPRIFDEFYISVVKSGEDAGTLEQNLSYLSQQLVREGRLRARVQSALIYPTIIAIALIGTVGLIAVFSLPQLVDFFNAFHQELPPTTKILLWIVDNVYSYGLLLLVTLLIIILGFMIFARKIKSLKWWHRLVLRLPLIGGLIKHVEITRFARNFGLLLQSGLLVPHSLDITANTLVNRVYKDEVRAISDALKSGKSIKEAILATKNRFPPIVVRMIIVGEKSGTLDSNLQYLADLYEEETDTRFKNLTIAIEPLLLIIVGLVVGFVAVAIISPIYSLTSGFSSL